jgi:hypothetical protein
MPDYSYNIEAYNGILGVYGITAGRHYETDAVNAWAVFLGGSGGHQYAIDGLNEIVGLVGGSGSFRYEIDALNEISGVLGGASNYRYVEDALDAISDLPCMALTSFCQEATRRTKTRRPAQRSARFRLLAALDPTPSPRQQIPTAHSL